MRQGLTTLQHGEHRHGENHPGPRRNPVAAAPILRKGGAHQKSKTAERTQVRTQLRRESAEWRPPPG
ncbi:MAG: hypothetical protein WAV07_21130 [Candidatus Contendobacter sp.]